MNTRFRSGGLARWSVRHPIGVTMLALAIAVPGLIALKQLGIDLLPHIIYPEIRVRINDAGVPARIIEDQVTRQLEEQLAITEGAESIQSTSRQGRSSVDLAFPYDTDIDLALRDASARLDRAKRFLPDSIDPPIIFKLDPSQRPVMELVVGSTLRDPATLRSWTDHELAKWFINLPGVASAETGGGLVREIHVEPDQERLAAVGLSYDDLSTLISNENRDHSGGKLLAQGREVTARIAGRVDSVDELRAIPLAAAADNSERTLRLGDVADITRGNEDERLRIRLNTIPGVKLSIQKQPAANTVSVADGVMERLAWLRKHEQLPEDIRIDVVGDQSTFVRHALRNAGGAAITGALLAMIVVYLFLGNIRRTLVVGSAIPLAILITFMLMQLSGLTLNIMTLGGLALGIGILVDSTIVMLENIYRHQQQGETGLEAAEHGAAEVNSAIVASTTTNLAAIVPFLFIGGLTGLLFRELITTISAAMLGALLVALTLVPALSAKIRYQPPGLLRRFSDRVLNAIQNSYGAMTRTIQKAPWITLLVFIPALVMAVDSMRSAEQTFLPSIDEGQIGVRVRGDAGMQLDEMDAAVRQLERLFLEQPEVISVFTQAGGFVYGRTQYQSSNRSSLRIQLNSAAQRGETSEEWVTRMHEKTQELELIGFRVSLWVRGRVRGIRLGRGDDDVSIRVRGPQLQTLADIGDDIVARLREVPGLRNHDHTYVQSREELAVNIDRDRAARFNVDVADISRALRVALGGLVVSDFIEGDQQYDVRLRLPRADVAHTDDIGSVLVAMNDGRPVRLRDVATLELESSPPLIKRDQQQRIVEVSASLEPGVTLAAVTPQIEAQLAALKLPGGYTMYDGGAASALRKSQDLGQLMLGLAIFLVLVVMAVQYESLRNPLVILVSIPFALIGVALGLWYLALPLSMPVWLGLIMLAGIVVNNAIVLVEQIEIERRQGHKLEEAVVQAARLRLRPILMTMLTTVCGMLPLALGLGEGSELLQPLAVVIVWGLSFSTLVSLVLVPSVYKLLHGRDTPTSTIAEPA